MTRDDIIRMAREAGWQTGATSDDCMECSRFSLERFAALVAAAEREACARVADTYEQASNMTQSPGFALLAKECAAAIRARGKTE